MTPNAILKAALIGLGLVLAQVDHVQVVAGGVQGQGHGLLGLDADGATGVVEDGGLLHG